MYKTICILLVLLLSINYAHAGKSGWTSSTHDLKEEMMDIGVQSNVADMIINECKRTAKDPRKCVMTAVSIYGNESGMGKKCAFYSCYGVISQRYDNIYEATVDWVERYNKFWYTHNGGAFFYGGAGWLGPSRYCTSEESSNTSVGCPNGARTFNYFYNKLNYD